MVPDVDPNVCEKTPGAVRAALRRRPDWLRAFEQEWPSTATDFDLPALTDVVDKWFPLARACATPGYLDDVEHTVRRMTEGNTEGMVFWDAEGRAYDAENNPVDAQRCE
ncbi:hypothetical protein OG875_07410 [Streptomyces sp. NBC_01498]|uniref:DUF6247 family protein n=1 Tax=Streptomyces sp. NBC_01498 TaxID=2975870 RepID=UPI002E7C3A39|nr:DUF6247 family protein [Streptomyces sp. NBC_01498]WTL24444.1 hypothetical protein OG875_07410 [Streptomyces sp. NBC_01498]